MRPGKPASQSGTSLAVLGSRMAKAFVAINDPVHGMIRNLTRKVPLRMTRSKAGQPLVVYDVDEESLSREYFSLAMLHSISGMPLSSVGITNWMPRREDRLRIASQVHFFDAVKLDRRCSRDLRLKNSLGGPGLLSCELLAFGCGVLRAANDDPADDLHTCIRTRHGRIDSKAGRVHARILALHRNSGTNSTVSRESYESTNLVYGDALGELEQLWERRAETDLMDCVAQSLQGLRQNGHIAAFLCPPLNVRELMRLHLRAQCMWNRPPSGARTLIRRLDYILEHLTVDTLRPEQTTRAPGNPRHPNGCRRDDTRGWADQSGFDGWLTLPPSED